MGCCLSFFIIINFRFGFNIGNGVSTVEDPASASIVLHMNCHPNVVVFNVWKEGRWGPQPQTYYRQLRQESVHTDIIVDNGTMVVSYVGV